MMNFSLQSTIAQSLDWSGIGLHSGKPVRMRLLPAPPQSGIRFVRVDLSGSPEIPARVENVTQTQMATTLGLGQASVSTVEHLLCAVVAAGIDNLRIEINGPEVPISDGSSIEFFKALHHAGTERQARSRKVLRLNQVVRVESGDKWAVAEPGEGFSVEATVEFPHPVIGRQSFSFVAGETRFEEFLSARTYGFLKEVEALKKMGLAQGGSLQNAIVLDDSGVLNPEGLRFSDEFARHKVLDAIGDLALAGYPILARVRLSRSGHELHRQLTQAIVAHSELVELAPPASSSKARTPLLKRAGRVAVS
ncbi:MAG: UDP-3-O-acyl-N-acetylglucosamine deacetylase [Oligoflexia bacterium]|jgi:UDP-3-O-[3-hydroxymyristoyl] N-acetylglucosamine deacetylase